MQAKSADSQRMAKQRQQQQQIARSPTKNIAIVHIDRFIRIIIDANRSYMLVHHSGTIRLN
jgi:hypothetical protein